MKLFLISHGPKVEYTWVPIGLLHLAAHLEKSGIEVKVIDSLTYGYSDEKILEMIETDCPQVIGFSIMTFQSIHSYRLAKKIKEKFPEIKIIYGGVHAKFLCEEPLKQGCGDFVVVGEGEVTTMELLNAFEKSLPTDNILGIAYQKDGIFFHTPPRPLMQNLDELPYPARHLVEFERYNDHLADGTPAVSVMSGRGCPYECVFCGSPKIYGRRVRYRSLDHFFGEIDLIIEKYGRRAINIIDDTFALDKRRVIEFCNRLIRENYNLKWTCLTRVNTVDPELLKLMKKAGCVVIEYGLESGDERILKLIKKHINLDQARYAAKITREAGIKLETLFMIGNIGETRESIMNTINFAMTLKPDIASFQLATPFPGTEFFDLAKNYGKVVVNSWDEYLTYNVTFVPNGMTKEEMMELKKLAVMKHYTRPDFIVKNIFNKSMWNKFLFEYMPQKIESWL